MKKILTMLKIRFVLLAAFLLLAAQCSLERKLAKYCQYCPVITKDSLQVKDSLIITRDTFWRVNPQDSTLLEALVICDSLNVAQMQQINAFGKRSNVVVKVVNGKLTANASCAADSLMDVLTFERHLFEVYKKTQTSVQKEIKEPLNKFFLWWFVGSLVLIVALLVVKLK
jgi:hypothetical protein